MRQLLLSLPVVWNVSLGYQRETEGQTSSFKSLYITKTNTEWDYYPLNHTWGLVVLQCTIICLTLLLCTSNWLKQQLFSGLISFDSSAHWSSSDGWLVAAARFALIVIARGCINVVRLPRCDTAASCLLLDGDVFLISFYRNKNPLYFVTKDLLRTTSLLANVSKLKG